ARRRWRRPRPRPAGRRARPRPARLLPATASGSWPPLAEMNPADPARGACSRSARPDGARTAPILLVSKLPADWRLDARLLRPRRGLQLLQRRLADQPSRASVATADPWTATR